LFSISISYESLEQIDYNSGIFDHIRKIFQDKLASNYVNVYKLEHSNFGEFIEMYITFMEKISSALSNKIYDLNLIKKLSKNIFGVV
jgi:hypothetical protein